MATYARCRRALSAEPDVMFHEGRVWVSAVVRSEVVACERLAGGSSSAVHACHLADGRTVVLREIADRAWLAREPDLIDREVEALRVVRGSRIVAPEPIAADAAAGRLLMTHLPGSVHACAIHNAHHAEDFAELAVQVAAVAMPDAAGLPPWRPWVPEHLGGPAWGDGALWGRAMDQWNRAPSPPMNNRVLLHRDLHPLNVLWVDGRVSGVVDWINACVGHPHAELGLSRWNLAVLAGMEAADRFLRHYLRCAPETGDYDPWWDLSAVLSFAAQPPTVAAWHAVGRSDLTVEAVGATTERFLRAALDAL